MSTAWLLLIVAWPLLELAVLLKVGSAIGFWMTMAIVVATGVLGVAVLMRHGIDSTYKVQASVDRGEVPLAPLMDGAVLATAGVLLITPGLCADAVGLLLLVPPLRRFAVGRLLRWTFGTSEIDAEAPGRRQSDGGNRRRGAAGPVIEGEFERIGERTIDPDRTPPERK